MAPIPGSTGEAHAGGCLPEVCWLAPWSPVDDATAEALLIELQRELAPGHLLYGLAATLRPIARNGDNLLVATPQAAMALAVVHLTWSRRPEPNASFPEVEPYGSWEEWAERCQLADYQAAFGHRPDFQNAIVILRAIRARSAHPDTKVIWAGWDSVDELLSEIDTYIVALRAADASCWMKLSTLFLPGGAFQDLSLSNGWGTEFLELAEQFDAVWQR